MRDKDRGLRFEAYRAAIPYRAELIVQVPRYLLDIVHGSNVVLDFFCTRAAVYTAYHTQLNLFEFY